MKNFLSILAVFISLNISAQYNWDSANWDKKSIGFGCSYSAEMTQPVIHLMHLMMDEDYEGMRKLLFSRMPANQFIGVFVVEKMVAKKKIELTEAEKAQINKIRESKDLVPVCAGCTYWDEVPLRTLLDKENKHVIYGAAEGWYNHYQKMIKDSQKKKK